jgi:hypothetical protein
VPVCRLYRSIAELLCFERRRTQSSERPLTGATVTKLARASWSRSAFRPRVLAHSSGRVTFLANVIALKPQSKPRKLGAKASR